MATLARQKVWGEEVLTLSDLNAEFNNITNFWTAFGITSPLSNALDASNQLILNPRFRKIGQLVNAGQYQTVASAHADLGGNPGIVLLPPNKTFTMEDTGMVTLVDGQYIVGSGWSSVIKKDSGWAAGTALQMIHIADGTENAGVVNCAFDGGDFSQDPGVVGIKSYGEHCVFHRLYFHSFGEPADGIAARNDGILLGDSTPADVNADRWWVTDCLFDDMQRNGVSVISGSNGQISRCTFNDCRNSAIDAEPNTNIGILQNLTFSDINATACLLGLVIDGHDAFPAAGTHGENCKNIQLNNINLRGNLKQGMVLYGLVQANIRNLTIDGFGRSGSGSNNGLEIRDASQINISGFTIVDGGLGTNEQDNADGLSVGGANAASEIVRDMQFSNGYIDLIARDGIVLHPGLGADAFGFNLSNIRTNRVNQFDLDSTPASDIGGDGLNCSADEVMVTGCQFIDTSGSMINAVHFAQKSAANLENIVLAFNQMDGFQGAGGAIHDTTTVTNLLYQETAVATTDFNQIF